MDDTYVIPKNISDVYADLSKFHLASLLGQKIPKICIMTVDLLLNETAIELEKLDDLGIGMVNPENPKDSPASCILIGKMIIVPTVDENFGIITVEPGYYSIICDIIIDTEKTGIPIKRVSQLDA